MPARFGCYKQAGLGQNFGRVDRAPSIPVGIRAVDSDVARADGRFGPVLLSQSNGFCAGDGSCAFLAGGRPLSSRSNRLTTAVVLSLVRRDYFRQSMRRGRDPNVVCLEQTLADPARICSEARPQACGVMSGPAGGVALYWAGRGRFMKARARSKSRRNPSYAKMRPHQWKRIERCAPYEPCRPHCWNG
jgi:hypothetical protein